MQNSNLLNFSGGPGILPIEVLKEASEAIKCLPKINLSILSINHRSKWVEDLIFSTADQLKKFLDISDEYSVLFLQGGSTHQFSMVPNLFLSNAKIKEADYLNTGYWSTKAIVEAKKFGKINVVWNGRRQNYSSLPALERVSFNKNSKYIHYISNETVEGLQFKTDMCKQQIPVVCDMSSDFLSRKININAYSLIYAHAQKNLGPAGVTVVVIKKELLKKCKPNFPSTFNYKLFNDSGSAYNTPPVFSIYIIKLILNWILTEFKTMKNLELYNKEKAEILYSIIDESDGFFVGQSRVEDRSKVNIVFQLRDRKLKEVLDSFLSKNNFIGLQGHRSVGGYRISNYNAMSMSSVVRLRKALRSFSIKYG